MLESEHRDCLSHVILSPPLSSEEERRLWKLSFKGADTQRQGVANIPRSDSMEQNQNVFSNDWFHKAS